MPARHALAPLLCLDPYMSYADSLAICARVSRRTHRLSPASTTDGNSGKRLTRSQKALKILKDSGFMSEVGHLSLNLA